MKYKGCQIDPPEQTTFKKPSLICVKVNESRYEQCGVTPHFSTWENLLRKIYWEKININKDYKKILRNIKY